MAALLDRESFRKAVFKRDNYECVLCGKPAQDAHHIMERRLWPDYGYYLENGASLCGECHILAEAAGVISCEDLRDACKITKTLLPPHLYHDQRYDKWGDIIIGSDYFVRYKGELADDPSVQKILDPRVRFMPYVKYPRTWHLPWSPGQTKDDRVLDNINHFKDQNIVITEKMDGENTSMYRDYIHARSINVTNHPSRARVKAIWSQIAHEIPEGWRLCGENMYARHSIGYDNLPGYFLLFSVWDGLTCLSWEDTVEWAQLLNIPTVPVLYEGIWDEEKVKSIFKKGSEGYVVRLSRAFKYKEFSRALAKYVRENHIQTSHHWKFQKIVPNKLRKE